MISFSFEIPGPVVPKARSRHALLKQCVKCNSKTMRRVCRCGSDDFRPIASIEMADKETARYENLVAMCAKEAMVREGIQEPITGAISLAVKAHFVIPPSRKKLNPGDPHTQRPDASNILKSIEDGLNKIVFLDDAQCCQIYCEKIWHTNASCRVTVEQI